MPRTARRVPLAQTIRDWVEVALVKAEYAVPIRKQVALLVSGLVAGEAATVSGLSRTLVQQGVSTAQEPSIARRLLRLLTVSRFDPDQLLPAIFRHYLPELLSGLVAAHTANEGCRPAQHARFRPVRLVVDESSQADAVHLLVVGLWYQGMVLPLAVRVWPQNKPLATGDYWAALGGMFWEIYDLLPPDLRDHVLLLADRGYTYPRFVDLMNSLGWAWVLRSTGQVRVQLAEGDVRTLRELVPAVGCHWDCSSMLPDQAVEGEPLAIFKKAGWRRCYLVGLWLPGQAEPWLLLTNLPATSERLVEYAQRWAIERLFLTWKSHGWQLEAGRVRDAARVGRLVSGLILATWWRVACAQPVVRAELNRLAGRNSHRRPRQQPSPSAELQASRDRRPWAAKFSLLSWGRKAIQATDCRRTTPALDWTFPDWDNQTPWPRRFELAAQAST